MDKYQFEEFISEIQNYYKRNIEDMYNETGCIDSKNESLYKVCLEDRLLITLIEHQHTEEVEEWINEQFDKFNLDYSFKEIKSELGKYDLSGKRMEIRMIKDLNYLNQRILEYKYNQIQKIELEVVITSYKKQLEQILELLK